MLYSIFSIIFSLLPAWFSVLLVIAFFTYVAVLLTRVVYKLVELIPGF